MLERERDAQVAADLDLRRAWFGGDQVARSERTYRLGHRLRARFLFEPFDQPADGGDVRRSIRAERHWSGCDQVHDRGDQIGRGSGLVGAVGQGDGLVAAPSRIE